MRFGGSLNSIDSSLPVNWHVLYTNPRNEKKVAQKLTDLGLKVYCPTILMLRQWSDRKKKVVEPLFKSYLFVRTSEEDRHLVFQAKGVRNYLFFDGKPAIVQNEEIEAIRIFCGEVAESQLEVSFQENDPVEIHSGLFKGSKGSYLTRKGNQIILRVESMGQIVKAEVPIQYIQS